MFQVPYTARQQYLAAQAEARAAQARAKAAEAEYFAQQAILQEEVALKARLYELEQRKRYAPSAFPASEPTFPRLHTPATHAYSEDILPVETPYSFFSYYPAPGLTLPPQSSMTPSYPLDPYLGLDREEQPHRLQCALASSHQEQAAHLAAEQRRLRKEQGAYLQRLAMAEKLGRLNQEIKAAKAKPDLLGYTVVRQGTHPPCPRPSLKAIPTSEPRAPQVKPSGATAFLKEGELKELFAALLGTLPTMAEPKAPHPTPKAPTVASPSSAPQSSSRKAQAPLAEQSQAGDTLISQLKARYKVDNDEEIKDTILAVIDSLSDAPAAPPAPTPAPAATKKPSSLVEQLQARSQVEQDQELRDIIQATINSLLPEFNTPPSPSLSASSSGSKDKGKASPPATPSVESRLEEINHIHDEFRKFESEFVFPSQLDFVSTPNPSTNALAHLAFTARNHPVRFYEQCLGSLLAELDLIESQGDVTLRTKRKETVNLVEQALETLEAEIMGRWKAYNAKQEAPPADAEKSEAPTSFTVPIVAEGVTEDVQVNQHEPSAASASTPFDAASSPADHIETSSLEDTASIPVVTPNVLAEVASEGHVQQFDDASTSDSQITVKPDVYGAPLAVSPQAGPTPASTSEENPFTVAENPSAPHVDSKPEPDAKGQPAEESEDNDSFLLNQTEEDAPKPKAKKAEVEDLGSDWSEVDA